MRPWQRLPRVARSSGNKSSFTVGLTILQSVIFKSLSPPRHPYHLTSCTYLSSSDIVLPDTLKLDFKWSQFQPHAHFSSKINSGRKCISLAFKLVHISSLDVQRKATKARLWCWLWILPHHPVPSSNLLPDLTVEPALGISCYCVPPFGLKFHVSTNSDLCLTSFWPWMIMPQDWLSLPRAKGQV